ncbi:MAG: hypothetical protein M3536_05895 [Actinomycetota bacterium]|nr:hypothetical protein [Actinomycetota bacterium]
MSERDELAAVIRGNRAPWVTNTEHHEMEQAQADAILAAGYRKPRTITTAAELDALPVGSVIRTSGHEDHFDPRVAVKTGFWMSESEWEVADAEDFCLDSGELDDLPATVLWEPQP